MTSPKAAVEKLKMSFNELLQNWKVHTLLVLLCIVFIYHVLPVLIYLIFLLLAAIGGVVIAVVYQPGAYKRRDKDSFPTPSIPTVDVPLSRIKPYPPPTLKPKLLSPRIDACLQDVINLTLEHHVIPTYRLVGRDHEAFFKSVIPQVWNALFTFLQRIGRVDTMKLVSQDIVQLLINHFQNFRGIHYRDHIPTNRFPDLVQFPYLESPEHELNFLRQVCEVLMCICLPKEVLACTPVRVLIREYLACQIFQPTISMICEPDYINQKMLVHLTKQEEAMERGKKHMTYKYKDFEDFMNQIVKCEGVEELQTLRQQVITDIIQAKAVNKMKHSHTTGLHGKQFPIPIPAEKLKVLMGRDLELYIRQLETAKASCDRQLRKQGGGDEYEEEATPVLSAHAGELTQVEKPIGIPFETVMKNQIIRIYLLHFLEECGYSHLLVFWAAAESLKDETGASLAPEIRKLYENHLNPLSEQLVPFEPDRIKPIEDFLSEENANSETCLSCITELQESVYDEIEKQFYQDFVWSDHYSELMSSSDTGFTPLDNLFTSSSSQMDENHHKKKLKVLKMELENKDSELSLMPEQTQVCHSLTQRKKALQKDRSHLREEIKKLEHYIEHTEKWFNAVGEWSVDIHSVDLSKDEHHDRDPLFIIIVHHPESSKSREELHSSNPGSLETFRDSGQSLAWQHHKQHQQFQIDVASTVDSDDTWSEISESSDNSDLTDLQSRSGWALGRHLSEFEKLHEKVIEICPNLQFPPLPKWLNPFQRPDANSAYWQKYRKALQTYLCCVLKDEQLKECEEVFNFISPASDNLRTKPIAHPEKKRFSLSNVPVIQSIPGMQRFSGKEAQPEEASKETDSTAEYMYLLVSEIFELDHFSRVLRKQLVEIVQLTYGKSIDREVQDTMNWVFSEPMLVFYLETFKEAMWPNGQPAPLGPTRSDEDKATTKEAAKAKLMKSGPQALQTILGQRNCQIGMQKTFELLQDSRGNKQLFYALLEILLYSLIPELEKVELDDDGADWKDA